MSELAALLLAAGRGRRLRPLTDLRPKPLCPVGNVALLDRALDRAAEVVPATRSTMAVNAHHLADQVVGWAADRMHVSVEALAALGTAGAVGGIQGWLEHRDLFILNGHAFYASAVDVAGFVAGWDRVRPRLLVVQDPGQADFPGGWLFAGMSLLPGTVAAALPAEPAGLYEQVWSKVDVDLVPTSATYLDCGTPADYLHANLLTSGGASVVAPTAVVDGDIERCVVWPDAVVHRDEHLVDCIRARDAAGQDITVSAT